MHPFIKKVVVAMSAVALAGMATASQARADTSLYELGSWFDTYADDALSKTHSGGGSTTVITERSTTVIILKPKPKYRHRHHGYKKHHSRKQDTFFKTRSYKGRGNATQMLRAPSHGYRK